MSGGRGQEAKRDTEPGLGVPTPDVGDLNIDRYRVNHKIGSGSMGVVWLGYDPRLERPVAIKQIRSRGRRETVIENQKRLVLEARALAKLTHPNVVAVYDAAIDGSDGTYLVMEYVPSPPLDKWIEGKSPSAEQIVDVFRDAARGLAAAHDLEIFHRDFKPRNVLVGKDRSVKVVDFGLALDRGRDPKKRITQVGTSVGTLHYMAPEVMLGRQADAKSDQYSFCVAFYESLYGRRPVEREKVEELRAAVIGGELEPPPQNPNVPEFVRAAIARGLSKDPAERFESMASLLEELEHHDQPPSRPSWTVALALALGAAAVAAAISVAAF